MISLSSVSPGSSVRVVRLDGKPDLICRLRELGLGENSVLRCLQTSGGCVCQIQHTRVGLSAQLAQSILVEPL